MKNRILLMTLALVTAALLFVAMLTVPALSHNPSAATPDEAMADEASPDEASPDEATPDERSPLQAISLFRGFVTFNGRQYYFDDHGVMQRGGIVGSEKDGYTVADARGVCCVSEEIRLAAAFMVHHCTGDTLEERMKTGFLYLAKHIPYVRSYDHPSSAQDIPALAIDMFTREKGNCYRYAACFACLAKIAGFRVRVVLGTTADNPHGWVEVLVGKKWLICDPDAQMAEKHLPDYFTYMMEEHCWQITPMKRIELKISEDGVAVWR